jgi:hypothetical protein
MGSRLNLRKERIADKVARDMLNKAQYILLADSLEYLTSGGRILDGRLLCPF